MADRLCRMKRHQQALAAALGAEETLPSEVAAGQAGEHPRSMARRASEAATRRPARGSDRTKETASKKPADRRDKRRRVTGPDSSDTGGPSIGKLGPEEGEG